MFLNVLQNLPAGGDFANLGTALDQGCQDLLGTSGFTAADCTNVHKAGLATELAMTPANSPQPADAEAVCPGTGIERVLWDSETGDPTLEGGGRSDVGPRHPRLGQQRDVRHRFVVLDRARPPPGASSLVFADGVALPPGQDSFLFFQNWRVLDWERLNNYDAGTVEVDDLGDAAPPVDAAPLPWVNGPVRPDLQHREHQPGRGSDGLRQRQPRAGWPAGSTSRRSRGRR